MRGRRELQLPKLYPDKTKYVDRLKDITERKLLRQIGFDAGSRLDLDTSRHDRRLHAHLNHVIELIAAALAVALATGLIFALSTDGLALLLFNPLYPTAILLGVFSFPFLAPATAATRDTELASVLLWASAVIWGLALAPIIRALPPATGVQLLVLAGTATVAIVAGAALFGATTRLDLRGLSTHGREAAVALLAASAVSLVFRLPCATKALLSAAVVAWSLVTVARYTQFAKDALDRADDEDRRCALAHLAATRIIGPILLTGAHLVLVLRFLTL